MSTMTNFKKAKNLIKSCKRCAGKPLPNRKLCYACLRGGEKAKRQEKLQRQLERKARLKEKKQNNQWWGKKVWRLFVNQLKKEQATFSGYITCYTCTKTLPKEEMQGGHCFHRGRGAWRRIDFDPRHIHFQCSGCNINGGGKIPIFTANLIRDYGWPYYEELKVGSMSGGLSVEQLKELFEKYNL